jgi:hypothetical protein
VFCRARPDSEVSHEFLAAHSSIAIASFRANKDWETTHFIWLVRNRFSELIIEGRLKPGSMSAFACYRPVNRCDKPNETFRSAIESTFGKMTVLVTDGQLPYPYGRELAGYEVGRSGQYAGQGKNAGVAVLVG